MAARKSGLGKGLDAIFMENEGQDGNGTVTLKLSELEPNRDQPRREFDQSSLEELAHSISQHGVLQPILVRPLLSGGYQIVAGERRFRASRMAGLTEVPVIIKEMSEKQMMEIALIENLQRDDLSPLEEAMGYQSLMQTHDMTQEQVASAVGKSRPAVTNALRLLQLPQTILDMLAKGEISSGHARALLSFKDIEAMETIAKLIVSKGLSVREVERLSKQSNTSKKPKDVESSKSRHSFFDEVELSLNSQIGKKVRVKNKDKESGVLEIEFYSKDELQEIAKALGMLSD